MFRVIFVLLRCTSINWCGSNKKINVDQTWFGNVGWCHKIRYHSIQMWDQKVFFFYFETSSYKSQKPVTKNRRKNRNDRMLKNIEKIIYLQKQLKIGKSKRCKCIKHLPHWDLITGILIMNIWKKFPKNIHWKLIPGLKAGLYKYTFKALWTNIF